MESQINKKLEEYFKEHKFKTVDKENIVDYSINVLGVYVPLFTRDTNKLDEDMVGTHIDSIYIKAKLIVLHLMSDWYKDKGKSNYSSQVKKEASKLRRLKIEKVIFPDSMVSKIITTFNSKKNLRKGWLT